jgi:hypothetical protein
MHNNLQIMRFLLICIKKGCTFRHSLYDELCILNDALLTASDLQRPSMMLVAFGPKPYSFGPAATIDDARCFRS